MREDSVTGRRVAWSQRGIPSIHIRRDSRACCLSEYMTAAIKAHRNGEKKSEGGTKSRGPETGPGIPRGATNRPAAHFEAIGIFYVKTDGEQQGETAVHEEACQE
jgi:hypothetical protein